MTDYNSKLKAIGLKHNFFEPQSENEVFMSKDLIETIHVVHKTINSNGVLYVGGSAGSGKTTIKERTFSVLSSSDTKIIQIQLIFDKLKINEIYDHILLDIDDKIKLSKRIVDREKQLTSVLTKLNYKKISFFVDNAHILETHLIVKILAFIKNLDINASIVFWGIHLHYNEDISSHYINFLSGNEKKMYLQHLHAKTSKLLPYSIPESILEGANNYFDINNRFVDYQYKVKMGIIKF